ncbi:hypothetical protein LINPERPRIM_LOCUS13113 [Linum perenne]
MEGVNNVNQNGVEQNPNQPHSQPAENQPQPIGAENQPQPIGAENQPQPASIAGNLGNGIGDDEDTIEQRKRTSDVWPHFHRLKVHAVRLSASIVVRSLVVNPIVKLLILGAIGIGVFKRKYMMVDKKSLVLTTFLRVNLS